MDTKSPFSISEEDVWKLEQNDGFKIVRAHLSNQETHLYASISILVHPVQELTTV